MTTNDLEKAFDIQCSFTTYTMPESKESAGGSFGAGTQTPQVELGDIPIFCSLTICSKYSLVIEPFTASTGLSFPVTHRMRYAIIDFRYEHVVAFSFWWTAGTDRKDECSAECSAGPS